MNAKKCDACGILYENYVKARDDRHPNEIAFINGVVICKLDLCEECMEKVKAVLKVKDLAGKK